MIALHSLATDLAFKFVVVHMYYFSYIKTLQESGKLLLLEASSS